ncbi:complex I NDUFA9 subunit family protein [Altererythrobacter sp. SALINAS58]|uniref:complex I NDUFA9 subunit family protein n=1 Tax=Alteripontixanthobacter muriae TaxID=2705546 RepID=UPI0015772D6E|nr:complex I NDUFA9 subunit family protein [Alteripontixanthobacter muriae]NTZ43353.1 complex I NDUFA9 subunit family protein [Alteripontixanthobacter muriae]
MAKRDTLDGKLVTLFGGSGFFGTHIAQELLECGARLRIASRNPEKAFSLKPLANLGQIQFARCDITDLKSVRASMHGADAAVNLVGAFSGNLDRLMGEGAGHVALAAREAGASALVQISAIGADADSASGYARAKALGEQRVHENFPSATILRPPILFAEDDEFITMFAGLVQSFPVMPVFAPDAPLQMLYVDDAADAVAAALSDPARHGGRIYEIAGPEPITMMELNRRIAEAQGRSRSFVPVPDGLSGFFAKLPGTPMGTDQWLMLKEGNVPSGRYAVLEDMGIEPRPLGLFLDRWMVRYRKNGRFADKTRDTI